MQSKKGVYALLVGSGVSRSSGILTGWEILLDLIHKLRILSKDSSQLDDITWYKKHFNNDPDYSDLLSKVAKTSEDRRNLLDSYFEPTENDREDGLKVPGKAHKAIADLVALGFIRVIITTNFDQLLS